MSEPEELSASMEDYLEAIYHIVKEKHAARAKDIARSLKVNNSSVTGALRSLSEKGFINYAPYDVITLTPRGTHLAEDVVRRHEALMDFFTKVLCVDESEASEAACKMEHAVSRDIIDRLIRFVEFIDICPRGGSALIDGFRSHCSQNGGFPRCGDSIASCMEDLMKRHEAMTAHERNPIPLRDLAPDRRGTILKIKGRGGVGKKLADKRITSGSVIEVLQVEADSRDMDVKVRGYRMTLSPEEAAKIIVEPW
ncbi:MAG: DtxR family transcriptional regulator [Desulfobacterales bacterium]